MQADGAHVAVLSVKLPAYCAQRRQIKNYSYQREEETVPQNYHRTCHAVANSLTFHRKYSEDPAQQIESRQNVEQTRQRAYKGRPEARALTGYAAHLDAEKCLPQSGSADGLHEPEIKYAQKRSTYSRSQQGRAG